MVPGANSLLFATYKLFVHKAINHTYMDVDFLSDMHRAGRKSNQLKPFNSWHICFMTWLHLVVLMTWFDSTLCHFIPLWNKYTYLILCFLGVPVCFAPWTRQNVSHILIMKIGLKRLPFDSFYNIVINDFIICNSVFGCIFVQNKCFLSTNLPQQWLRRMIWFWAAWQGYVQFSSWRFYHLKCDEV